MQAYGVNDLNTLSQIYKEKVNLIMVYISEAHANDEWPISNRVKINQHKTIEERTEAVKFMQMRYKCDFKILIDSVNNEESFENKYCGWPERGFIFYKNKLEYVSYAEVNSRMHWFNEFTEWLNMNGIKPNEEI
jgi:hypothetical protein